MVEPTQTVGPVVAGVKIETRGHLYFDVKVRKEAQDSWFPHLHAEMPRGDMGHPVSWLSWMVRIYANCLSLRYGRRKRESNPAGSSSKDTGVIQANAGRISIDGDFREAGRAAHADVGTDRTCPFSVTASDATIRCVSAGTRGVRIRVQDVVVSARHANAYDNGEAVGQAAGPGIAVCFIFQSQQ